MAYKIDINELKAKIRSAMRKNGFITAAAEMEFSRIPFHQLSGMLQSWDNYPACMDIYPLQLRNKPVYNEAMMS